MTIQISGQNFHLTEDQKSYASEKVLKFVDLIVEPAVCDIMLIDELGSKDGEDKSVHITLTLPGEKNPIHVEAKSSDFFASIDLAQEKLEREIIKYKEKIKIGERHSR